MLNYMLPYIIIEVLVLKIIRWINTTSTPPPLWYLVPFSTKCKTFLLGKGTPLKFVCESAPTNKCVRLFKIAILLQGGGVLTSILKYGVRKVKTKLTL